MSLQLHVVTYEATTPAAEEFCKDYALWMELSTVNDVSALEDLDKRYAASTLTKADYFIIWFNGDYITSVDSYDLRHE